MRPGTSGALAGFGAGLAALGVVHGIDSGAMGQAIVSAANTRGVDPALGFVVAYLTAGALGALIGTAFGVVTRYLRRWGPLTAWALVFFTSVSVAILALAKAHTRAPTLPILAATAAFAIVVSLSLPIRRVR